MNLEHVMNLPFEKKKLALKLLEQRVEARKQILYLEIFKTLYNWQLEFIEATRKNYECCLCAANQIGKSYLGVELDAVHLLGDYPENWPGYKFDFPPYCWALGFSMEKTRDLLQTKLFGKIVNRKFEGGLVPADKIVGYESAGGTVNAMRTVTVKHKLGISTIQFWSYSQGQHAIMGDVVDWFHIDEEPKDQKIRPQVLTRTINGDRGKGGRGIYTFTPENGKTDLVMKFMEEASESQFFMQKGWCDAPHITDEKAERLLSQYPEYQREMRSTGTPMLGHGRIYNIGDEYITCDPFEIPDHWFVIGGMDFGWNHPQAQVRLVEDRDQGNYYLVNAWKASEVSANDAWGACKKWQAGVPIAWPADGLQHEKGRDNAMQQKIHYENAGFNMLFEHATWPEGGNSVESGLMQLLDLMRKGKFKAFRGLLPFFEEFRQYHRNDKNRIVKVRDDILDALRYAFMMRRYAVRIGSMNNEEKIYIPSAIPTYRR